LSSAAGGVSNDAQVETDAQLNGDANETPTVVEPKIRVYLLVLAL